MEIPHISIGLADWGASLGRTCPCHTAHGKDAYGVALGSGKERRLGDDMWCSERDGGPFSLRSGCLKGSEAAKTCYGRWLRGDARWSGEWLR